jgi:hypothetical protein
MTKTNPGTHQVLINSSYESRVVSWLMQDGWQIFTPILDHGHQTDILISDGPNYYRVQVKTIDAKSEDQLVENKWKESNVDCVIFFARNSNWGYVAPAFTQNRRKRFSQGVSQGMKCHNKALQPTVNAAAKLTRSIQKELIFNE